MAALKRTVKLKTLAYESPTVKNLDDLCRKYTNLRDRKCQRCGRGKEQGWKTEWSHFISRANKSVRWDEDNSCILCFNCHYKFGHAYPKEFSDWWEKRLGPAKFAMLRMRAHATKTSDRWAIHLYLTQKIKELECKKLG